ncbi:protein kinase [Nocardia sp. NPDC057663]|uniref:serine/threonine-protein kinase n=1 Tax=Nocardia sp. NPDC057663 TaxID=3346201 RepID=UPI003670F379
MLGKGGMGEVYEAYDTGKDRVVALKLLAEELAQDPSYQVRFRRESQAAAKLAEPHIIPIHDWGVIDGVLFIDMRLVPGTDLRNVLRAGGPMSPDRAVAVVEQIAAALDAAHAGGLVHRDVKPANILVTPADFAYLADFGIAHTEGDSAVTQAGMAMGSYIYMAPERFDVGPISHRADVYSLACVLHECLTGASPFPAASMSVLIRAHLSETPPRPSEVLPGLPSTLDEVIARGMAKDPADRYASAGALAVAAREALAAAIQGGAPMRAPGFPQPGGQGPVGAFGPAGAPAGAAFGAAGAAFGAVTGAHPVPSGPVPGRDTSGGFAGGVAAQNVPPGATTGGRSVPGGAPTGATTGGRNVPGGAPAGATTGGRNVSGGDPAGATTGGRAVPGAPGEDAAEPAPTPTGEFRVVGAVTATGGIETSRSQTSATGAQPTLIIRPPAAAPGPAETTGFHRVPVEGTGEISIPAVIQPTGPAEIRAADTHFTPLPPADATPTVVAPAPPPAYTPDQGLPKMRPFPDAHLFDGSQPGETSAPIPTPAPPFPAPTGFAPPADAGRQAPAPRLDVPSGPVSHRAAPTQRFSGDPQAPAAPNPRFAPTQQFGGPPPDQDARFGSAADRFDDGPADLFAPPTEQYGGRPGPADDPQRFDGANPDARFGSAADRFGDGPIDLFAPPTEQYGGRPGPADDPQRFAATRHFSAPEGEFGPPTEQYEPGAVDAQRSAATQHFGGGVDGRFGPATEQYDPVGIDAQRSAPTQHYQSTPPGADRFAASTEQYDDLDPQRAQATRQYRGGAAAFPAHQAPTDDPARAAATRQYAGPAQDAYAQQYDDPNSAYGDHAYRDPADPYGPDPGYTPEQSWQQQNSRRERSMLLPILVGVLAVVVLAIGGAIGWRLMSAADSAVTTAAAPSSVAAAGGAGGAAATTAPRATTAAPTTSAGPVTLPAGAQPCESGSASGAFGKVAVGSTVTSCGFAEAVRAAYASGGSGTGSRSVVATSPVTGRTYTMDCTPEGKLVTCTGGENAVVYVY